MRKFKQLLLLVISITLVSCHTTGSIKQKAWKVQQGMTTEEIGQLLGKPDFRRFDGSLEQWEYQSGGIATSCKFLIIEFRNGKVTSMDSYNEIAKETSVGEEICDSFYIWCSNEKHAEISGSAFRPAG